MSPPQLFIAFRTLAPLKSMTAPTSRGGGTFCSASSVYHVHTCATVVKCLQ